MGCDGDEGPTAESEYRRWAGPFLVTGVAVDVAVCGIVAGASGKRQLPPCMGGCERAARCAKRSHR